MVNHGWTRIETEEFDLRNQQRLTTNGHEGTRRGSGGVLRRLSFLAANFSDGREEAQKTQEICFRRGPSTVDSSDGADGSSLRSRAGFTLSAFSGCSVGPTRFRVFRVFRGEAADPYRKESQNFSRSAGQRRRRAVSAVQDHASRLAPGRLTG